MQFIYNSNKGILVVERVDLIQRIKNNLDLKNTESEGNLFPKLAKLYLT